MDLLVLDQLKQLDQQLSDHANTLFEIVAKLEFQYLFEFSLASEVPPIPDKVAGSKGVYLFEVGNDEVEQSAERTLQNFAQLWKDGGVTWVPGIKKRRILAHQMLAEWIPLYLGKSRNVGGRIAEHIFQIEGKTTFSMKLKARSNLNNKRFRVSWIPLSIHNYDMLAPAIESALRNLRNPIVGKQ